MDAKGGRQSIYIYIMLVIGTSKHKLSFMGKSEICTAILWMLYNQRGNILQMVITLMQIGQAKDLQYFLLSQQPNNWQFETPTLLLNL